MNAPKWVLPVAIVAILWNLMGLFAFVIDLMITPELIATLPDADQALYAARPGWMIYGTSVAVILGVLGSVGLALRKQWSLGMLIGSLIGVLVQDVALVLIAMQMPLDLSVIIMQALVLIVAVELVFISRKGAAAGWLGK